MSALITFVGTVSAVCCLLSSDPLFHVGASFGSLFSCSRLGKNEEEWIYADAAKTIDIYCPHFSHDIKKFQ